MRGAGVWVVDWVGLGGARCPGERARPDTDVRALRGPASSDRLLDDTLRRRSLPGPASWPARRPAAGSRVHGEATAAGNQARGGGFRANPGISPIPGKTDAPGSTERRERRATGPLPLGKSALSERRDGLRRRGLLLARVFDAGRFAGRSELPGVPDLDPKDPSTVRRSRLGRRSRKALRSARYGLPTPRRRPAVRLPVTRLLTLMRARVRGLRKQREGSFRRLWLGRAFLARPAGRGLGQGPLGPGGPRSRPARRLREP